MFNLPIGNPLTWKQNSITSRTYTLKQDEQPLAHLYYTGTFNNEALVHLPTNDKNDWLLRFDRQGVFNTMITSKATNAAIPATKPMKLNWSGKGEVVLGNGRSFRWHPLDTLHTQWGFLDEQRNVAIEFKQCAWTTGGKIIIHDNSLKAGELNLLTTLGWYKSIHHTQEMMAVAVAVFVIIIAI